MHGTFRPNPVLRGWYLIGVLFYMPRGVYIPSVRRNLHGADKGVLLVILHCWKGAALNLTLTYAAWQ